MAVEYGTIGIRPRGEYDPDTKYDLLNLVVYDGSSYVAHTDPPKGTLPTDTNYWQVSAQGTGKATADSVGTVKPDGTTTEVSAGGDLSVKQATQTTAGIVKGSDGITVADDGSIDVNTQFTQATELANLIAGEAIKDVLGKVSKSIATMMNLDQNALLKNMLTSIDVNDSNKVPTSAFVHTLVERIDEVNSNLTNKADKIVYPSMPSDADSAFGFASRYPNAIAPYSGLNWTDMPTAERSWYGRVETRGYFNDTNGGNILFYSNFGTLIASRGFKNSGWSSDWIRYATNSDLELAINGIAYSSGGTTYYAVKNGVCYVDVQSLNLTAIGSGVTIANGLPAPAVASHIPLVTVNGSDIIGLAFIDSGTTALRANINKVASNIWVSFSYPITS